MTHETHRHCNIHMRRVGVSIGGEAILHDVNLSLHCGEITALIGRNGAGKSTLLSALLREVRYTGEILFTDAEGRQKDLRVGYVPQRLHMDPSAPLTVYDLCAAMMAHLPGFSARRRAMRRRVTETLREFGAAEILDRRVSALSGGELQRVLLTIALNPRPELLLLDEPTTGIDQEGLRLFYDKLCEIKQNRDLSILLISHDFDELIRCADRMVLLDQTVLAEGPPADVMASEAFAGQFHGLSRKGDA